MTNSRKKSKNKRPSIANAHSDARKNGGSNRASKKFHGRKKKNIDRHNDHDRKPYGNPQRGGRHFTPRQKRNEPTGSFGKDHRL